MKKLLMLAAIMSFILSNALTAYSDVPVNMLPVYKSGENVGVTTNSNNMNIQIQGGANSVGTANWKSFHIGKDASVNVEFTNQNQTSLNYVDATGGMSQIYGKFTDSGAYPGKIILHNPNGIFFGNGANVNVNSLTATTMNGVYDKNSQTLKLTKNANANKDYGIVVDSGAKINGRQGVAFASNNIDVYKGSQLSAKDGLSYAAELGTVVSSSGIGSGNIKLVTSDGVNFTYENGSVDKASDIKSSTDKMMLYVAGSVEGKNIEMNNASTNVNSQINMKGAVLKAVGGSIDPNGNIILTSNNKVVTEDTKFETVIGNPNIVYNISDDFVMPDNFQVKINAKNNISLNKNTINSDKNITLKSEDGNVNVHNSTVKGHRDITLDAGNVASIQTGSKVEGSNVTVKGGLRGQVVDSEVNAKWGDVNITSDNSLAWTRNSKINSNMGDINIKSNNDGVLLQNTEFTASYGNINVQAFKDIKSSDLQNSTFTAKDSKYSSNISVKSSNNLELNDLSQFKAENKLNLGGYNVNVSSDDNLDIKNTNFEGFKVALKSNKNLTIDGDTTTITTSIPEYVDSSKIPLGIRAGASLEAGKDIKTTGTLKTGGRLSAIAGNNIDLNLDGVSSEKGGLYAKAGNNINITQKGALAIHSIQAGNDLTLNADSIIPADPVVPISDERRVSTDPSVINNILVGGTFTSNVTDNYEIVSSTGESADGQYATEHVIKYGNSNFYLKNKLPIQPQITPPTIKPRDLAGEDETK